MADRTAYHSSGAPEQLVGWSRTPRQNKPPQNPRRGAVSLITNSTQKARQGKEKDKKRRKETLAVNSQCVGTVVLLEIIVCTWSGTPGLLERCSFQLSLSSDLDASTKQQMFTKLLLQCSSGSWTRARSLSPRWCCEVHVRFLF